MDILEKGYLISHVSHFSRAKAQRADALCEGFVRSIPRTRAALDTFHLVSSRARRIWSLSADSLASRSCSRAAPKPWPDESRPESNHRQDVAPRQDSHSLDGIAQFTNVPRPGVVFERLEHFLLKLFRFELLRAQNFGQKVFRQRADILAALPERRNTHRHHAQAIIQVLANFCCATISVRSRLVAETTRTETRIDCSPPTR